MSSTRQLRINDPALIRQRIHEFLGKKINIVFADSRVIVGELEAATENGLTLRNMRGKKARYTFNDIDEIYFDTIV